MRYIAIILVIGIFIFSNCSTTQPVVDTAKEPMATMPAPADMQPKQSTHVLPGTEVQFEMVLIPGGEFLMGSPASEVDRSEDEGPQHNVKVEAFWMGQHEVTFEAYNILREKELDLPSEDQPAWDADAIARPSPPYEDPTFGMGKDGYPAVSMTQFAAHQYCKWLSDKTGTFYRLPTEAEWEYACKAGKNDIYYFGNDKAMLADHAWYTDNSMEKYHEIGTKKPNDWGLYDMLGNVSEWTLDQYQEDAYTVISSTMKDEVNPWIKPTRLHPRTVRGGSWDDNAEKQRCSCRIESSRKWKERDPQIPKSYWWNTDSPFVGFRIVSPAVQPSSEEQAAFWEMVLG